MRLLLDTHVAIWTLVSPERLAAPIREMIEEPANSIHISAVTIWEIAIKFPLVKKTAPPFSGDEAIRQFRDSGYLFLNVTPEHAAATATLPLLHADPFDRLLVAQALTEPMRLVTHDRQLAAYSHTIITP